MTSPETVTEMAQQHAWGWQPSQIALYHGVPKAQVLQMIDNGFPTAVLPQCGGCGEPFMPVNPSNLYCSDDCKRKAANERAAARKRAAVDPIMCATCGAEFRPIGKQRYCSVACRPQSLRSVMAGEASAAKERKRGETAVILPSERKPKRTGSMTDSEFVDALAGIRPGQRSEMREMLVRRLAARMAATKTGYAKRETGEAA